MPRVRDLLAAALATLRAKHTREIDGVLIAALRRRPDADPVAACAAARVIRDIGAATPGLADALSDAAVAWNRPSLARRSRRHSACSSPGSVPEPVSRGPGFRRRRGPATGWRCGTG